MMIDNAQLLAATFADDIVAPILSLVLSLFPLVIALILFAFFWGLAKFMFKAGDAKAQTEGKDLLKWGLVAVFIAFSLYGILLFLNNQFALKAGPCSSGFGIPKLPPCH